MTTGRRDRCADGDYSMSVESQVTGGSGTGRRPQQRYPRTLLSVPVTLRNLTAGGIRSWCGTSLDISEGGLGAIVRGELRVGEMVELDVPLAERTLSFVGIVRHTSSIRSGFEFLGLTADERQQIACGTGRV